MGKGGIAGDAGASAQALNNAPIAVGRDWSIQAGGNEDFPQSSDHDTYVQGRHGGNPSIGGKDATGSARSPKQIGGRMRTMAEMYEAWPRPWQAPRQVEPSDSTAAVGRERGDIDYGYAPSNALAVSARGLQDSGGTGAPQRVAQLVKSTIRDWAGLLQHGMVQTQYQLFMRHESFAFKQQYQARKARSISGVAFDQGPTASRVRIPAIFVPRTIS